MKKKFRFMAWLIELRISKKSADERILFVANKLFDEIENAGHSTKSRAQKLRSVDIYNHSNGDFKVENSIAAGGGWEVRGKRAWK